MAGMAMGSIVPSLVGGLGAGAATFGLSSLFGGGGGGSGYRPTGQGAADQQLQGLFNNYSNPYNAVSGYNTNYLNSTQNNPYTQGYQSAGNMAGGMSGNLGGMQYGALPGMFGLGGTGTQALNDLSANSYQLGVPTQNMVNGAQTAGGLLSGQGYQSLGYANQLPGMAQGALGGLQGMAGNYAGGLSDYAGMTAQQLPGLAASYAAPVNSYAAGMAQSLPGYAQGLTSGIMPYANQQAQGLTAGANQVMNTAFDPQNQLYNQQFHQNQEQTRAGLAARGLNMSGVGAGIENQSNQDFNTNWQNQQLGRQTAGLQAYGGATGQALGGLESGSAATYNPYSSALGQGFGGLNTAANTGYGLQSGALGQGFGALNSSANTGYGIQSGAAGQFLSGMQGAMGQSAALGQQGAQNVAAGAAMPYNALYGAMNNFAGLQGGIGSAAGTYGNLYGQGSTLGAAGVQNTGLGGQLPFGTYNDINNSQYGGLSNYLGLAGQGQGFDQSMMGNLTQYLGYGNSAANGNFMRNQSNMSGIGSLLGGIGSNGGFSGIGNGIMGMFDNPYSQSNMTSLANNNTYLMNSEFGF